MPTARPATTVTMVNLNEAKSVLLVSTATQVQLNQTKEEENAPQVSTVSKVLNYQELVHKANTLYPALKPTVTALTALKVTIVFGI